MAIRFTNNAASTIAASINTTVTSISLAAGTGARFPTLSTGDFFYATIVDSSNNLEIVKVTARAVDSLTVVRGQDGTSARSFTAGDKIELRPVAAALNALQEYTPSGTITADTIAEAIAELDSEKAPKDSPTFTGTPSAPTANAGTNTTQLATTAFVTAALQAVYPVGSVYVNATNATNPGTLLGFGTWVSFGAGRMPVGFDAGDPLFDSAEETGGSKDAVVVSHTHTGTTDSAGAHTHTAYGGYLYPTSGYRYSIDENSATSNLTNQTTGSAGAHTHTFTTGSTGSSGTNANLPPYITVYMWKRTA